MPFREDDSEFDQLQLRLIEGLMKSIRDTLEGAGVDPAQLPRLTTELGFSVASILDGSEALGAEEDPVRPFVAFARDEDAEDVVYAEGGSWLHEYVHAFSADLFGEVSEDEDEDEDHEEE